MPDPSSDLQPPVGASAEFGDAPPPSSTGPEAPPPEPPHSSRSLLYFGLTLVGAVVLMFAAYRYSSQHAPSGSAGGGQREGTGQMVPDFTLKDIQGNTFRMADLKGKVIIVDFWATWCGPCKVEIPWFIDMYDKYRAQGLEVVGIAMDDEGLDVVKPFADEMKMNYRVLIGDEDVATKFGGIFGLPTTFIVDRSGKIVDKHVGLVSRDVFEESVKKHL